MFITLKPKLKSLKIKIPKLKKKTLNSGQPCQGPDKMNCYCVE